MKYKYEYSKICVLDHSTPSTPRTPSTPSTPSTLLARLARLARLALILARRIDVPHESDGERGAAELQVERLVAPGVEGNACGVFVRLKLVSGGKGEGEGEGEEHTRREDVFWGGDGD